MVKRSVTLLEETIFQHVTIHKLMIYIYGKMKMSQDPLLAVIRTNILELKNMARYDPLVLVASSKTVLKTLLNFTRLTCISKEALHFIRKLMHDVYVRMRKLWEMYKVHGAYEIPKKVKLSADQLLIKENLETKCRQSKKNVKSKNVKKNLIETLAKNDPVLSQVKETSKKKASNKGDKNDGDIEGDTRSTVDIELAKIDDLDEAFLLERIQAECNDSNDGSEGNYAASNISTKDSVDLDLRSPKKRKVKKWSMGIFQAKKKKKGDHSNNKSHSKTEAKVKDEEDVSCSEVFTEKDEPDVPEIQNVPETKKDEVIVPGKEFEDDENSLDKCNIIIKDADWGERLRVQREYYLNEMSKVTHRLTLKKNALPKYDFVNKLSNKMGISVTTSGYTLNELMVMDHSKLIQPFDASSPSHTDWVNMEPNSSSTVVGIFKATRSKKRFVYECLGTGCMIKTTQLQVLHKHAADVHKPFKWDWSCSSCGNIPQILLLKAADALDLAMYHLTAHHSTVTLKRNPVELEFSSLELRNKPKTESPINKQNPASNKSGEYFSHLYKCSNCSFSSGLYSDAYNHYLLEVKDSIATCVYCLMTLPSAEALCEHLEMYHASSIFLCSECPYRSVSVCNTIDHFYELHENIDENKEIFIYINIIPAGLVTVQPTWFPSSQLTKYVCKHPDKEDFITLVGSKFIKHVNICPNQGGKRGGTAKKFECSLCFTKVGAAYRLRQHYETHQVALYVCVYCGQGYAKLSAIKEHLSGSHMMWQPRFIIREDFDEIPEELRLQYSTLVRYETDLESLIEVSVEVEEFQDDSSRIKLQMVSGDLIKWDNFVDNPYEAVGLKLKDYWEKERSRQTQLNSTKGDLKILDLTGGEENTGRNKGNESKIIEINRDSEEMGHSLKNRSSSSSLDISSFGPSSKEATNSASNNPSSPRTSLTAVSVDERIASTIQGGRSLLFSTHKEMIKAPEDKSIANSSMAVLTILNPSSPQIITGTPPLAPNLTSCSHEVNQLCSPETPSPVCDEPRTPEIRIIAEAKMDNFRKLLPVASDLVRMDNFVTNDVLTDFDPSTLSNIGNDGASIEERNVIKTVPNILSRHQFKPKSKTILIHNISRKNEPSNADCVFKCPYCNFKGQGKVQLTQHISRLHVDVINLSPCGHIGGTFVCAVCGGSFEAFAALHKHAEIDHKTDCFGVFRVYVDGHLLVRKNIKICFLCSTLIVSLEQLYKHPDVCPFAHTTGTSLNSSIVYAAGKNMRTYFLYKKTDIKVNKSIVELLQPHLPTSTSTNVPTVKRAVAKKSTGPRPLSQDSSTSVANVKRAVAKKSTGPYFLPQTVDEPGQFIKFA